MVSPGFFEGNNTTMATTPAPSRISTNVPRNSAINSAISEGFGFIRISAAELDHGSGPRSSLPSGGTFAARFSLGNWQTEAPESNVRGHFFLTFGYRPVR